jgi:hypothetical protein
MLSIVRQAAGDVSRRQVLQAAGAGLFGLTLPKLLAAEASAPGIAARAKSVIFLTLFGGPSQLETFDLKPNAPEKIRGPFKPTPCKTPGLLISDQLPRLAACSDKFCVIRSMTHSYNDHSTAGHYIQTGHPWHIPIGGGFNATPRDWPSIGSVVEFLAQNGLVSRSETATEGNLPNYVVAPNFLGRLEEYSIQLRRPGEYAGWLGRGYDPLTTTIDLLSQFDDQLRIADRHPGIAAMDKFQARAFTLATSQETRQALDIRQEPAELRDKYGRNLFGQSVLLARRLVEAGVRYVTVQYDAVDGYSWDSHIHSNDVQKFLLPSLDNALASLLEDLSVRGLLDETLVVCLGEMGRTPQANGTWGRGHWSTLFPAVIAGAGIRGGIVYGGSDKDAAYPIDRPTSPEDFAATIYHALGIDHHLQLPDAAGRPVSINDGGRPLVELFG